MRPAFHGRSRATVGVQGSGFAETSNPKRNCSCCRYIMHRLIEGGRIIFNGCEKDVWPASMLDENSNAADKVETRVCLHFNNAFVGSCELCVNYISPGGCKLAPDDKRVFSPFSSCDKLIIKPSPKPG